VVTFASATGRSPVVPIGDFFFRRISLHSFYILAWLQETPRQRLTEIYTELATLVERGELHAAVEATYPLDRYREALAHAARPERSGKVLFTFDQPTA
jgi:NADPH:quinone reductase-like Zn-dependent oxidoreductase